MPIAAALSLIGLALLALPGPAPMVGLAFACAGAWLGVSTARRRRSPARGRAPRRYPSR